jgi:hypothetical protein
VELEFGAGIEKRTDCGETPLLLALGNVEIASDSTRKPEEGSIVKALLEAGADVLAVDGAGRTVLQTLAYGALDYRTLAPRTLVYRTFAYPPDGARARGGQNL